MLTHCEEVRSGRHDMHGDESEGSSPHKEVIETDTPAPCVNVPGRIASAMEGVSSNPTDLEGS